MEGIDSIISTITSHFQSTNIKVSKVLAAFVVRSVIHKFNQQIIQENPTVYNLDKALNEEDLSTLINTAIAKLSKKNQPSLETIKMQVSFDEASILNEEELSKKVIEKQEKLKKMQAEILNCHPKNLNDFDTLVLLYRQIYSYLILQIDTQANRTIEKEIAAAMESVFPRTGLKVFISLYNKKITRRSPSDKISQLNELSSIVLGIFTFYSQELGFSTNLAEKVEWVWKI